MRLYLDTEWADSAGRELISLALVDSTAQYRFYAEVDPLPKAPTDFVRAVVYPLLEHGYAARQPINITRDLRVFLDQFPEPRLILADHLNDFTLLHIALRGFTAELPGAIPHWKPVDVRMRDVLALRDTWFERDAAAPRHHAAADAEALRWAFERILHEASKNRPRT